MSKKDIVENQYKDVLDTLDEDLTDEDIQKIIEEESAKFKDPIVNYSKNIDLKNTDDLTNDFLESRDILTKSIDRMEKVSNICFENLLVDKSNPMLIDLVLKVNSNQSANVKQLLELHSKSHQIIAQQKKNSDNGGKKDSDKPSAFVATKN